MAYIMTIIYMSFIGGLFFVGINFFLSPSFETLNGMIIIIFIIPVGGALSFMPYVVTISILKYFKLGDVAQYVLGGVLTSIIASFTYTGGATFNFGLLVVLIILGAVAGIIYHKQEHSFARRFGTQEKSS